MERGEKFDARAFNRCAFRALRQRKFRGTLRRVTRRAPALQERQHRLQVWVYFAAAEVFSGLQTDDRRIRVDQSADFFAALESKRRETHRGL